MRYTLFIQNKEEFSSNNITHSIKLMWSLFESSSTKLFSEWLLFNNCHVFDNKENKIIWQKSNDNLITHK